MNGSGDAGVRVLVVEDAAETVALIDRALRSEGWTAVATSTGEDAVLVAREAPPDVVVLDVVLPGMDGIETCRRLRIFSDAYVIMLTARGDEVDKLVGLAVGADDYLTKPFSARELVARIKAMLRRPRAGAPGGQPAEPSPATPAGPDPIDAEVRRFGDLEIDDARREVRARGDLLSLTKIEYDLIETLTSEPRRVFTRRQLLERIWGPTWYGDEHVLDVHVSNLRRKLGDDPRSPTYVITVRGVGFRLGDLDAARRPGAAP